eukprot:gene6724-8336_t
MGKPSKSDRVSQTKSNLPNKTGFTSKKVKGTEGNIGQSRYNDIEKNNKFHDQRIGEYDSSMTEEDKMLARFQKEKLKNKNLYNLNDDEEELTHLGQSLGNVIQDDYVPDSDDDGNGGDDGDEVGKEFLSEHQRFGSGSGLNADGTERKKSSKEIYQEIIEKSKNAKAERARDKLRKEGLTRELDEEFELIRNDLPLRTKDEPTPFHSTGAALDDEFLKFQLAQQQGSGGNASAGNPKLPISSGHDDFDSLLVELAGDAKARATDRLKTAEEIFKEEREKLEKLEQDRLKRMRGEDDVDYDDDAQSDGEEHTNLPDRRKPRKVNPEKENKPKYTSADSHDDDEYLLKFTGKEDAAEVSAGKKQQIKPREVEDIPFTFDVPKDLEELNEWLHDRTHEQKELILSRIRVCNHITIKPQNKEKMKTYLPILYQRFIETAKGNSSSDSDQKSIDWKELNLLNKYIFEISQDVPDISSNTCRDFIDRTYKRITKKLELRSTKISTYWPNVSELLLFKLLGNIFPTSDFYHQVLTPTIISLNSYLSHCPIKSGHDIYSSLFLSNILLFYLNEAKRYSPEITSLLVSLLSTFINQNSNLLINNTNANTNTNNNKKKSKQTKNQQEQSQQQQPQQSQWTSLTTNLLIPTISLPEKYLEFTEVSKLKSIEPNPLDFNLLMSPKQDSTLEYYASNQFRVDLLNFLISYIEKYVNFYSTSQYKESLPSLLSMFLNLIGKINNLQFSPTLMNKIKTFKEKVEEILKSIVSTRVPLTLLTHKPAPLKQFNPRFNQVFSLYNNDPDQERAAAKRMKAMVKKEMKGAIREVTKDNYFIQQEKRKQKDIEKVEVDKKRKQIMSELQQEQSEFKKFKKTKDRLDGRI